MCTSSPKPPRVERSAPPPMHVPDTTDEAVSNRRNRERACPCGLRAPVDDPERQRRWTDGAGQDAAGQLDERRRWPTAPPPKPSASWPTSAWATSSASGRTSTRCGANCATRSEEHTSETPVTNAHLVCRLLLEKKKTTKKT